MTPRTTGRALRHLGATVSMLLGVAFVLGLIWAMNRPVPEREKEAEQKQVQMQVQRTSPPPRRPKPKPKPKPRKRQTSRQPPPPQVSSDLTQVGFSGGGIDVGGLGDLTRDLLGAEQSVNNMVMTEDAVDSPPRATTRVPPRYPPRARARGLTGKVTLELLIGPQGDVVKARVIEADPPGVFEQAAMDAVRQWRFRPATYKGQPVKMRARQVVRFKLG